MQEVTFQIRHGTQDRQCFDEVVVNNQYHLPEKIPADAIIIDVGANVGAFAVACLLRGAGTVVAFEPCPLNYQQLLKNTSIWYAEGKVAAFNCAVWRSDRHESLNFVGFTENTACGGVFAVSESLKNSATMSPPIHVDGMGLDEILFHVTDGGKRRVDVLKIDAEGSEYSILYTCTRLHLVDHLIVETHQSPNVWPDAKFELFGWPGDLACADGMLTFLKDNDFSVQVEQESFDNQINTLLFATRFTPGAVK